MKTWPINKGTKAQIKTDPEGGQMFDLTEILNQLSQHV